MALLWLFISNRKQTPRDYPEIKKEGILRIVTEYNSIGYHVSGDTIEGFQYELSKAIEKISGLTVEIYLENNLEKSIIGLNNKSYDIIARNIPITTENKKLFAFTNPITLNKQVLVQRTAEANDNLPPIRNQIELAKKTLHIAKNSPSILRLRNLEEEIADTIFIVEDALYSDENLIYQVAGGDIDYAVVDYQIAAKNKNTLPQIDIQTDISFTQLQAWAVRKNAPVLLDSLNRWLKNVPMK
ncbi:MAG: transporter substrate-binding domain-containing protein [Candidatus Azobacteroides sp.]|nr:transporter substrate-binding domain-containing protein [Candidatus Azobacteroides sp.]